MSRKHQQTGPKLSRHRTARTGCTTPIGCLYVLRGTLYSVVHCRLLRDSQMFTPVAASRASTLKALRALLRGQTVPDCTDCTTLVGTRTVACRYTTDNSVRPISPWSPKTSITVRSRLSVGGYNSVRRRAGRGVPSRAAQAARD